MGRRIGGLPAVLRAQGHRRRGRETHGGARGLARTGEGIVGRLLVGPCGRTDGVDRGAVTGLCEAGVCQHMVAVDVLAHSGIAAAPRSDAGLARLAPAAVRAADHGRVDRHPLARLTRCLGRFRDDRGAELIELALVLPILLFVSAGILEFGFLFQRFEVITNAAREGARLGALPGYGLADADARTRSYIAAGANGLTCGMVV